MIRALNENDVAAFIKIRCDSLQMSPSSFGADPRPETEMDVQTTRRDLANKNDSNFILGYFEGAELAGIVGFIREQRLKTKHRSFIWGVFVYPAHRGKGIATQLMEETMQRAKRLEGLQKVTLSVTDTSLAARKVYEKLGFKEYAREPDAMRWEGEPLEEIFMSVALAPLEG